MYPRHEDGIDHGPAVLAILVHDPDSRNSLSLIPPLVGRDYQIIDGVHLNLDDEEGLQAACMQGRDLGFDGKTLIHPKQIEVANQIFAPSAVEVKNAREILYAWEEAQKQGKGVVVVNGRLVENLHVEEAKRLLALAGVIGEQNGNGNGTKKNGVHHENSGS